MLTRISRARRGVAQRVLEQVDHQPVQLVARPVDTTPVDVERRSSCSPLTGPSSAAASTTISARSHGSRADPVRRRVRASSSRSATSRRIRCEERSAERAARPARRRATRRAARGSRARSSAACAARATRPRRTGAGAPASPRSPRARRRARGAFPRSVRASSATSSSAFGCGTAREGSRVRAISAAVARQLPRSAPSPGARSPSPPAARGRSPRARPAAGTARPARPSLRCPRQSAPYWTITRPTARAAVATRRYARSADRRGSR